MEMKMRNLKDYLKLNVNINLEMSIKMNGIVWSEDIKLPEVLSKENIIDFIDMLIEKLRSTINGMTFIYGKGVKDIK